MAPMNANSEKLESHFMYPDVFVETNWLTIETAVLMVHGFQAHRCLSFFDLFNDSQSGAMVRSVMLG